MTRDRWQKASQTLRIQPLSRRWAQETLRWVCRQVGVLDSCSQSQTRSDWVGKYERTSFNQKLCISPIRMAEDKVIDVFQWVWHQESPLQPLLGLRRWDESKGSEKSSTCPPGNLISTRTAIGSEASGSSGISLASSIFCCWINATLRKRNFMETQTDKI